MKLELNRILKTNTVTIGELFINGNYVCDILEDKVRELPKVCPNTPKYKNCTCKEKVYGKTAVPAGTYEVKLTYSSRFKRVLPEICSVPHFLGIRIHKGNSTKDTEGCLLPGTWDGVNLDWVKDSTGSFNKIMKLLQEATDRKEEITITINTL